jgi:DNA-binding CsgD family transcriptional regulator
LLEQLHQSVLLTDQGWEEFRQLFEQVHQGYLVRLKEKLPGLSPAEIRLMTLCKLHYTNKEMAAMLGVSTQAIRQLRSRLRRKLNLPEEIDIEELAAQI